MCIYLIHTQTHTSNQVRAQERTVHSLVCMEGYRMCSLAIECVLLLQNAVHAQERTVPRYIPFLCVYYI